MTPSIARKGMDARRRCLWLLAVWALARMSPEAWATSYPESLNLASLADRAERIFVGEVLLRATGTDPAGLLATVYTFRVDQAVKGNLPATVTIKQIGVPRLVEDPATGVLTFPISGMPVYEPGQRYLLFLNGTSEIGFTSPVGLGYGAFTELPTGGAVNHLNNAGLFRGMPAPPLRASAAPMVRTHRRGPVDLSVLVDATAALAGTVPLSPGAGLPSPPAASPHHVLTASPPGNVGALVGGHPFRWNIPTAANPIGILGTVPYDVEAGPLGNASNASAVAKVAESFAKWAAPATTALAVTGSPGTLGVDVNAVCPSPTCYQNWYFVMDDGKSPIIFDADGSITAALSGSPCGFGGVGGFQGRTTNGGLTFTLESTVVLDGAWLGGVCGSLTLDEFGGTITHELGHFLTIDHTIVNGELVIGGEAVPGAGVPPCASVEVMLSNAVPGCTRPNVLQKDDISIVSLLYPSAGFATGTGRITGHLFAPNGVTPVNCGNIIVRNAADPFFDAVASITGISKELGTAPPTQAGAYQAPGLTLGASYVVGVTQLPGFAAGGSNVTDLCDPVPALPGPEEFYNGSQESADPATDNPSCSVPVGAATSTPGIDIVLNSSASSAAPCGTAKATLTVTRAGGGTGTVTSTPPGIGCGADCREDYDVGSVVELAAAAGAGSRFTGWSGGGCNGTGGCTVTLTASTTVTATFQPQTVTSATLTVNRAGTGSGTVSSTPAGIACGTDCSQVYPIGTVVTLTATPADGSRLTAWSGGGCSGTGACVLTVSAVTTVTATFQPLPAFRVTVAVNRTAAGPGETTVGSLTIRNPGIAAVADFYLGVVLPDGETLVLLTEGGGHAFARASDLGTLPRVATAVSLARPFTVALPSVFAHTWTGAEAPGTYLFFLAAVSTGSLADGSVGDGELLAVTHRSFVFTP